MRLNFDNPNEIRARYIGLELAKGSHAQRFYDRTGSAIVSPNLQTFSELGMPWIDRGILRSYSRPRIFTVMAASLEHGEFFPEVESFLQTTAILGIGRWQAILYRSGAYENTYRSYSNSKALFGASNEWLEHQTVCIDQDFLIAVQSAAETLIFGIDDSADIAFRRFVCCLLELPSSMPRVNTSTVRNTLKELLAFLKTDSQFSLDELFLLSEDEVGYLESAFELQRAQEIRQRIQEPISSMRPSKDEQRALLSVWVRSLVFHFVIGHELGHISFATKKEHPDLKEVLAYLQSITGNSSQGDIEECYCDYIGAANCMHQSRACGIPFLLCVLITYVAWLTANAKLVGGASKVSLEARRRALYHAWLRGEPIDEKGFFASAFNDISSLLSSAFFVVTNKMKLVSRLNILLNPNDEDRTRSLNQIPVS
jgi:hypothetical protein